MLWVWIFFFFPFYDDHILGALTFELLQKVGEAWSSACLPPFVMGLIK